MTSIKDKLASSVRQAKSATPTKAAAPRAAAEDTKQTNIQADPNRQIVAPAHGQDTGANPEPASSAQVLFPDRVWPD